MMICFVEEQELVYIVVDVAGCLLSCCPNWGGDAVPWAHCHP